MNPKTRLAIRYTFGAVSLIGTAIAGSRLWKAHPVAGGAVGVFIVSPAIGLVVDAILPTADVPPVVPLEGPNRGIPDTEYSGLDRNGNPVYTARQTRGTQVRV